MKLQNYLSRVEQIDQLIRTYSTGQPADLADKVGISESMLYNYLQFMRRSGAPIEYSRLQKTYFYRYQGKFSFSFETFEQELKQHLGMSGQ